MADIITRLADLERRMQALETELRQVRPVPPAVARAATGLPAPKPQPKPAKAVRSRIRCPLCPMLIWPSQQAVHDARWHPAPAPDAPAAPPPALSDEAIRRRLGVSEAWRCQDCLTNQFAQSIRNPQFCVRCAKRQPIASSDEWRDAA